MAVQRLHSSLAPIDLLTREELASEFSSHIGAEAREFVRGLDVVRFPRCIIQATGTSLNIGAVNNDMVPLGPEQGDIWLLRRAIVKSNVFADTAKYILFRGSTPSDTANAYGILNLLDAVIGGATPGQNVNVSYTVGNKAIWVQPGEQIYALVLTATAGNQYMLDGEALRVPAEMKGKLIS